MRTAMISHGAEDAFVPRELQGADIQDLIPHRADFLFVKSLRLLAADRYQGLVTWRADQAGLAGHFPGSPIVPAVFIVEAAAQIAGAGLLAARTTALDASSIGVLAAIRRCVFSRPVFPGQAVQFVVQVDKATNGFVAVKGSARVADEVVANLDFVIAVAPRDRVFGSLADSASCATAGGESTPLCRLQVAQVDEGSPRDLTHSRSGHLEASSWSRS